MTICMLGFWHATPVFKTTQDGAPCRAIRCIPQAELHFASNTAGTGNGRGKPLHFPATGVLQTSATSAMQKEQGILWAGLLSVA